VYLGNKFCTYIARSILPGAEIKVLTAKNGVPGLFGSQHVYPKMPAIISEGWFDSLAIDGIGYINSYALGSNRITEEQMKFLSQFPFIILVSDNDEGGNVLIDNFAPYSDTHDIRVAAVRKFFGEHKDASKVLEKKQPDRIEAAIKHADAWAPSVEEFVVEIKL
jgi:DNA primase